MRRTHTRLIAALPAAALLWAGLTGCSFSASTNDLDITKAEEEIAKGIKEQTGVTATVNCPEPVQIKSGATFTCEALATTGEGGTVTVTQTDDQGNIKWNLEPVGSPSPTP